MQLDPDSILRHLNFIDKIQNNDYSVMDIIMTIKNSPKTDNDIDKIKIYLRKICELVNKTNYKLISQIINTLGFDVQFLTEYLNAFFLDTSNMINIKSYVESMLNKDFSNLTYDQQIFIYGIVSKYTILLNDKELIQNAVNKISNVI